MPIPRGRWMSVVDTRGPTCNRLWGATDPSATGGRVQCWNPTLRSVNHQTHRPRQTSFLPHTNSHKRCTSVFFFFFFFCKSQTGQLKTLRRKHLHTNKFCHVFVESHRGRCLNKVKSRFDTAGQQVFGTALFDFKRIPDVFDLLHDNTECTLEISFGDERGGPLKGSRGSTTERE